MSSIEQKLLYCQKLSWQVKEHSILTDLSFAIAEGEFVGLIGPNGAGKSSLLRCLYRKIQPTQGKVYFNGEPIQDYSSKELAQQIAVVLQEPPSQFEVSIKEVIALGLTPHKPLLSFDNQADHELIQSAAKQVNVQHLLLQSFNSLSGGEKQRVMIARAIVQQPRLLLMDEPTNHLDVHHQIEVLKLARQMNISVIVSIHDLNLAAAFCDRLILLNKGHLIAEGSCEEVLNKKNLTEVFEVDCQLDQHPFHSGPRITFNPEVVL